MAAFVGFSVSMAASGASVARESSVNKEESGFCRKLNRGVAVAKPSWRQCRCAARGCAADVYSRGLRSRQTSAAMYARDRVVSFGKNKGSMLGTLSSSYLRWMVKNLRGTMLDEWADYAQDVLDDPLYRDRIEWEKVEKLLVQSHDLAKLINNKDALAPARMYGWDLNNEVAWSQVNFSLLGTTKGGRIPRKPIVKEPKSEPREKPATSCLSEMSSWTSTPVVEKEQSPGSLRDELDRRRQARRERLNAQRDALLAGSKAAKERAVESRFPGREGILSKLQKKNSAQ